MKLLLDAHALLWFNRLLIAQALADGLTIVTRDIAFSKYPAKIIW